MKLGCARRGAGAPAQVDGCATGLEVVSRFGGGFAVEFEIEFTRPAR
jgi:hypothetical protein